MLEHCLPNFSAVSLIRPKNKCTNMYNPPANSTYTQSLEDDIFDLIENDLAKYSEKGNILIMGDLNAMIMI